MKHLNLTILGATIIILSIVFGIATIKITGKYRFKKTAQEMLEIVTGDPHSVSIEKAREVSKSENIVFIDIRTPKEYDSFQVQHAINIPYDRILDDGYVEMFKSSQSKVLYGNSSVEANAAWMILTQYGYQNLLVLNASAEDWMDNTQIRDMPKDGISGDEVAHFDYEAVMNE